MQVINSTTAVAATPVSAKPTKTFRFEFSKGFIDELSRFSKVHQFDERRTYKEAWQKWKSNPEIDHIITIEVRRLEESGYVGDIEDKMFKSGRYYFRKKTLKLAAAPTPPTTHHHHRPHHHRNPRSSSVVHTSQCRKNASS